jgi:hypothetical protein
VPVESIFRSRCHCLFRFLNISAVVCAVLAAPDGFTQSANSDSNAFAITSAVETAARTHITRQALEAPIRFLASDALEGRGPARSRLGSEAVCGRAAITSPVISWMGVGASRE